MAQHTTRRGTDRTVTRVDTHIPTVKAAGGRTRTGSRPSRLSTHADATADSVDGSTERRVAERRIAQVLDDARRPGWALVVAGVAAAVAAATMLRLVVRARS